MIIQHELQYQNLKQCIQIHEARSERRKKYANTFTYYNNICL